MATSSLLSQLLKVFVSGAYHKDAIDAETIEFEDDILGAINEPLRAYIATCLASLMD
jgi:hypothetical protein